MVRGSWTSAVDDRVFAVDVGGDVSSARTPRSHASWSKAKAAGLLLTTSLAFVTMMSSPSTAIYNASKHAVWAWSGA